jgi:hypothetical protein
MTLDQAIEILTYHNRWRQGLEEEMKYSPKELTMAIELILVELKNNV